MEKMNENPLSLSASLETVYANAKTHAATIQDEKDARVLEARETLAPYVEKGKAWLERFYSDLEDHKANIERIREIPLDALRRVVPWRLLDQVETGIRELNTCVNHFPLQVKRALDDANTLTLGDLTRDSYYVRDIIRNIQGIVGGGDGQIASRLAALEEPLARLAAASANTKPTGEAAPVVLPEPSMGLVSRAITE